MIKVYTKPGCPRCEILKKKLTDKGIDFDAVDNEQEVIDKGYDLLPVMVVDGKEYDFAHANTWVNERTQP